MDEAPKAPNPDLWATPDPYGDVKASARGHALRPFRSAAQAGNQVPADITRWNSMVRSATTATSQEASGQRR